MVIARDLGRVHTTNNKTDLSLAFRIFYTPMKWTGKIKDKHIQVNSQENVK